METVVKITQLESQMLEANKKLDKQSEQIECLDKKLDTKIDALHAGLSRELGAYVRKEEFGPVKSIVYGLVGMILTAVVGALIYLVVS